MFKKRKLIPGKSVCLTLPIKTHTHTNPNGTTIEIRSVDAKNSTFWDDLKEEWVNLDKLAKTTKERQKSFYWFDVFLVIALLVALVGAGYIALRCMNN